MNYAMIVGRKGLLIAYLVVMIIHISDGSQADNVPRGHLQQIGLHRDPEGHVDIVDGQYSAEEFWTNYVSKRRPVLLKGAAKDFPGKTLWTDDYLSQQYGRYNVKLEMKKESQGYPIGDLSVARDTIDNFLATYRTQNKYIVSQLPKPMYGEVLVPPCLSCGSFSDSLVEVNLWMSNGGTKSLLHKDAPNILNCLLNGTKNWILISPKHEYMVPLAREPTMDGGGFSVLKVDKIDLIQFSKFKDCPYHYANVSAGDCLYVPYGELHHVRSFGDKNVAVSFLFSRTKTHLKKFNNDGCQKPTFKNLADVNVDWDFDGLTSLTMGLQEPKHYKETIMLLFNGKTKMTTKRFINILKQDMIPDEPRFQDGETLQLFIDSLQLKDKKFITLDDLEALPSQSWKNIIKHLETDPVNTLEYEYKLFSKEIIREFLNDISGQSGGFDAEQFVTTYHTTVGGSTRVGKSLVKYLDADGDGIVTKEEYLKNKKKVLNLFEEEIPEEHVNNYHESYVYRKPRPEVSDMDEMDPKFSESQREALDEGVGIPIGKNYELIDGEVPGTGKYSQRSKTNEAGLEDDGEPDGENDEEQDDDEENRSRDEL